MHAITEDKEFLVIQHGLNDRRWEVREQDDTWCLERLLLFVREKAYDRCLRLPRRDLFDDGVAELRLHDRSDREDSDILEEQLKQILIELSGRQLCHDLICCMRLVRPLI